VITAALALKRLLLDRNPFHQRNPKNCYKNLVKDELHNNNIPSEGEKEPVPSLYISFVFHCGISFLLLVAYDAHFTAMSDKPVNNKVHSANTQLRPYTLAQCCTVVFNTHIIYTYYIIKIIYRIYIMYRYTYLYHSFDPVARHVLRAKYLLRSIDYLR